MLGGIGVQEILIILVVGLLVFGAARLPKIARSLGLGIKEFKKTIKGIEDDEEEPKVGYSSGVNQTGQQNPPYNQYNQWQAPPSGPNPYQGQQYQNPNYQQAGPNPYASGPNPYQGQNNPQNQGFNPQGQSPQGGNQGFNQQGPTPEQNQGQSS